MTAEKIDDTPKSTTHSNYSWLTLPKEDYYACVAQFLFNPYKTNKFGNDMLTEKALKLAQWKRENVFPVDLKVRAPAVLFGSIVAMKSQLISGKRT